MEKDPMVAHRKHRPGAGALPSGVAPGHRVAGEVAELQRSRSVGGLHHKGDPPSHGQLLRELEPEDQGRDPRSCADDASGQVHPEDKEQSPDSLGKVDGESRDPEPSLEKSEVPALGGSRTDRRAPEAEEQERESMVLSDLLEKETPSMFVEIDLEDHTEEVATCAMKGEGQSQMDTGDLSEDETRTSWVCCIPYTSKRKAKEGA
ncbi:uncharacterized protein C13orf46 homolog isoform X2 [Tupaia chinensis]|uniref:uncharacterized protein C13orf46 homolog isoform X2 n=1 Tax=Tupaia chinensis TaxID=246437 RepID=UPI0003C8EA2E|nr:uncharacterized protein C13orf46 homolog isoform X2 [Tupaia chinensis]